MIEDYMITYIENSKDTFLSPFEVLNEFREFLDYNINI